MGQQPNIEITLADLPRAKPTPQAARRWSPRRPGELTSPDQVPWGGAYGRPGPDAGYALRLAQQRPLELAAGEKLEDAEAAVAALAAARASYFGRAPVMADVDVAAVIMCYDSAGVPADVAERITGERVRRVADLAHNAHRSAALVASVPTEVLVAAVDEVRAAVAEGSVL